MMRYQNKFLTDIQIVSFDIGNTLINLDDQKGFSAFFCEETNIPLEEIRPIINNYFLKCDLPIEIAVLEACKKIGYADVNGIIKKYEQLPIKLFNDVIPVLRQLTKDGFLIIACSNCSKWDAENSDVRIKKYISKYFYSFQMGTVKPEISFFNAVCRELNVRGNSILHVGDSLKADYFGAINAGWNAVLLDRKDERNDKYR